MPAPIYQIDLAYPVPELRFERRWTHLWLLIKFGPQPLGWVRCDPVQHGRVIGRETLAKLIADSLCNEIQRAAQTRLSDPITLRRTPMVSIVVALRQHPVRLERLLQSIAALRYPAFEVIVVESDARDDRAAKTCSNFFFAQHVRETRPGISYARNTGWQLAAGEIVAFADENTIVDANWLLAIIQSFQSSHVQCVRGTELSPPITARLPAAFDRREHRPSTASALIALQTEHQNVTGGFAVRRETLRTLGGFDAALGAGTLARGGEVRDLLVRILRSGGSIVDEPRAICFSQTRPTARELRINAFDNACGLAACAMKYSKDLELGNRSVQMIARRLRRHSVAELLRAACSVIAGGDSDSSSIILSETIGFLTGLRAYRKSARRVRYDRAQVARQRAAAAFTRKAAA